jgi:iron complex outermembrane receptor protein
MIKTAVAYLAFGLALSTALETNIHAQNGSVQGTITGSAEKEPVPLVTVYLTEPGANQGEVPTESSLKGAISDFNGFYRLENKPGTYIIHYSAVGFKAATDTITIKAGEILFKDMVLEPSMLELNEVVYAESRNPQKIEESTVSISLVKPELIRNRNATSADLVIEQIPGVTIVDAEPQIRGGSGFSSGLGSRVLILIDGMPVLRADAGRPMWSFYPMENTSQIEVVKGASSVLYGSGASNGVINIRTAYPTGKPLTKINLFTGVYSGPNDSYKKPWTGFNPLKSGMNFLHSRIIKPKSETFEVDLVLGGQALWDQGFKGGEPLEGGFTTGPFDTTRTNIGEYERSIRMNFNTRFRIKKWDGFSFGLNGNAIILNESQSFFWQDADTNIYRMLPGSLTNFNNFFAYLDPYLMYSGKKGAKHILRARLFGSWSDGDVNGQNDSLQQGQDSRSRTSFAEYQFSKDFSSTGILPFITKDLSITAGVTMSHTWSTGGVFSATGTGDSTSNALNAAAYVQLEKKFFKRLTLTAGGRYEYFQVNDITEAQPVFRVGSNFRLTDGTFIRASWGQGFRFPTIGERFISTFSGGSGFFANPDLEPETSWSGEIGLKQLYRFGKKVRGFVDISGFWQEYENFVEFAFVGLSDIQKNLSGFRFFNTGKARIRGTEAILYTQLLLHKNWSIDINAGYTYSLPQTLEPDLAYATSIENNINVPGGQLDTFNLSYNQTATDTSSGNNILKYRVQHLVNGDVQINFKGFSLGYTARYYSTMQVIDRFFVLPGTSSQFGGLQEFLDNAGAGAWVFDARINYSWKWLRVGLICENLFNAEYSVRPLGVAPPRLTTLQIGFTF